MFRELNEQAYHVGGFVRDGLLGIDCSDRDYVLSVGEQEFAQVFPDAQRVGSSFPVYLIDSCETALTRSERSTGVGYTDFAYTAGVTIEEDLGRRDFTINSIAMRYGVTPPVYIDPYGGMKDLRDGILRTINPTAFQDDPLRMVRACRFLARFPHFRLEKFTRQLIEDSAYLMPTVLPERIEAELQKVYKQSPRPSVFFKEMFTLGLLKYHFPTLEKMSHVTAGPNEYHRGNSAFIHTMEAIDRCKELGHSFEVFMAVLTHDFGKATTPKEILPHHYGHEYRSKELAADFFSKHRFSYFAQRLSLVVAENHMRTHLLTKMRPAKVVKFIRSIRKELRDEFFCSCECDHEISVDAWGAIGYAVSAIEQTVIDLPATVKSKGREAIEAYVNDQITKTYMEFQRNMEESNV